MEETKTLQEEYSPTDAKREKVRRVAVAMIDDFPEHPFKVKDDEEMEKLKDSICGCRRTIESRTHLNMCRVLR